MYALLLVAAVSLPSDTDLALQTPEGLSATLWAESPHLYNPTAIDIDPAGRVWVAEAVNYRKWDGRNPGRDHPEGDRIVRLEDTDGDGRCDTSTVFAQDAQLVSPLGIAVLGERVIVSCSPDLLVYTDENGDGLADKREVLLTGFGGRDHDHGLHSVVGGPDGRLYFAAGNAGPHIVTDRSGWTLRSGSYYSGGGPAPAPNRPGLRSDDGRIWTGGLVLRCEPDGSELTVLAHNFRNNYEVAVNAAGDLFQSDNDDDGNASCRTLWVMEGGNYGFFSNDGTRSWQADRRPGQATQRAHWHQDDPGISPAGTITGAGGPTGVTVYEGEALAQWIGGAVLDADAGRGAVYIHRPQANGAGIELEESILIEGPAGADSETARWFRPSDVAVAPDGSVLVADWYDPGVGGHWAGDKRAYGRLVRISAEAQPAGWGSVPMETDAELARAIDSPVPSARWTARERLLERGSKSLTRVLRENRSSRAQSRAFWLMATLAPDSLRQFFQSPSLVQADGLAITAFRALRATGQDPVALGLSLADRCGPGLRRELAIALRDEPLERMQKLWLALAQAYTAGDRSALEALGIGAEGKEAELYAALFPAEPKAAELDPLAWSTEQFELAWRLHPPAAVPAFAARASDAAAAPELRRAAVDALAFINTREAAESMLHLALGAGEDVRPLAAWWSRHRGDNDWRDFGLATDLGSASLERAKRVFSSGIVRAGRTPVDVDVTGCSTLWLVADEGANGNSCDWAAWLQPRFLDANGEPTRLVDLTWNVAEAAWGSVNVGRDCTGGALEVDGVRFEDAIGTHAASRIAYAVPPGAVRFVCEAAPEDTGRAQNAGRTTELEFQVWVEHEDAGDPLAAFKAELADTAELTEATRAALNSLAGSSSGALWLLDRSRRGALSPAQIAAIEPALRAHPDDAVRALASGILTASEASEAADAGSPSLEFLSGLIGEPEAGRAVFTAESTRCVTCHRFRGRGGDIGPELTHVGAKLGRRALFDAILRPSAAIAHGFDTYLFELDSGQLLAGFLIADGPRVVIKDTQGQRHAFDAESIVDRGRMQLSTMPEDVAAGLSAQELADLVAFLSTPDPGPPSFGEPVALFNGKDLTGWAHHLSSRADPNDVWTIRDGVLRCSGQPIGYLRTEAAYENFELTLEWRFDPEAGPGNSGVLLRVSGPDQVWPRSIEAQLHSGNAGDIWNIEAFPMETAAPRTEGRRTRKLQPASENPIGEWNRYVITLDGDELSLVVNGVLQNRATWCAPISGPIALQSEGAVIEFRSISLRPILR